MNWVHSFQKYPNPFSPDSAFLHHTADSRPSRMSLGSFVLGTRSLPPNSRYLPFELCKYAFGGSRARCGRN